MVGGWQMYPLSLLLEASVLLDLTLAWGAFLGWCHIRRLWKYNCRPFPCCCLSLLCYCICLSGCHRSWCPLNGFCPGLSSVLSVCAHWVCRKFQNSNSFLCAQPASCALIAEAALTGSNLPHWEEGNMCHRHKPGRLPKIRWGRDVNGWRQCTAPGLTSSLWEVHYQRVVNYLSLHKTKALCSRLATQRQKWKTGSG